jgi:hypothetical protein
VGEARRGHGINAGKIAGGWALQAEKLDASATRVPPFLRLGG